MEIGLGLIPRIRNGDGYADVAKNGDHNHNYDEDSSGPNELLIRIYNSSASPVVIGRYHLLTSFRGACCPQSNGGEENQESNYPEHLRWGFKALSRQMLRFSDAGMQVRGNHSIVRVNNTVILSDTAAKSHYDEKKQCSDEKPTFKEAQNGWSINPVKIRPGDILSLEPRVGSGLLEFNVVALQKRTQDEGSSTLTKTDDTTTQILNGKLMTESTEQQKVDLTDELERQQKSKRDESSLNLSRQATLDDDSKTPSLNTAKTPIRTNSIKLAKSSLIVHFFPFGNGFSASRRQKLARNLEQLGATITNDMWKANYIVISESIRSLDVISKRMHVEEERLLRHLAGNGDVQFVLPSWADYCIASAKCLSIPSRIHTWCSSSTHKTSSNTTTRNIALKRMRDEIDDNGKQTFDEEPKSRKKVMGGNDDTIQTRRECRFRRNVQVAEAFKNLGNLHQSMSLIEADKWKSYCFRIVAGRLLELDFEVNSDEETMQRLLSIKGFGKGVCGKIQECIEYGTISRIQEFKSDPQRQAMKNLKDIWGVGTVRATDLIDRGYRTIDDVRLGIRENRLMLDRNQLVGVDCYEDILERMPRSEAEAIGEMVRKVAESIFPGIEASIMGSYRRGKEHCGDVDIQLTHPGYVRDVPNLALGRIVDKLWNEGKIAMHLTFLRGMTAGLHYTDYQKASHHVSENAWERTKTLSKQTEYKFYMGCLYSPVKPQARRRVDIKFYPYRDRAFATLYFTGNGYFNRSMRLWAKRVFGLRLSDQGMFKLGEKTRVFEASTEREIFDRLELVYREPHERHYWDALEPLDKNVKPDLRLTESELKNDDKNQWVE